MSIDISSPDTQKLFLKWTHGDQDAARLILQFCALAREVDDLIDEGDDNQTRIMTIVELSLVHISNNPFYMRHVQALSPLIYEMLVYWKMGDDFKKSEDEKKQIFGFVYRESTDRIVPVIAGICGGVNWGFECAKEAYEATHGKSKETLEDWLRENNDGTV